MPSKARNDNLIEASKHGFTNSVDIRYVGACAVAVLFGTAILFHFDPTSAAYYPRCLFHEWTGLYCPGCGATRAMHALLHGHLLVALSFNPLAVVALPFVSYRIGRAIARQFFPTLVPPLRPARAHWIWLLAACVILFGILRNLPVHPFDYLAPGGLHLN